MAYSYIQYTGNGSTTNFAFSFPYLNTSDISVTVNGTTTAFTLPTSNVVAISPAPPASAKVVVARNTTIDHRLVDFVDGSVLTEKDLDVATSQSFYLAQESWDKADIVLAEATATLAAAASAKDYANLSYKYEQLALNWSQDASDSADRAQIFKDLSATYADQTKTASQDIAIAEAVVISKASQVEATKNEIDVTKGLIDSQAALASSVLTSAQTAAANAQSIASAALTTANAVSATASGLETTIATVASQQTAALAAKNDAQTAATAAASSATTAASSATGASSAATTATTKAGEASTSATTASSAATTATTQAGIATTKAGEASSSATAAASSASAAAASASSIDVSTKADTSYVNTQLGLKANTSSLATVATTGVYSDLTGKPTLFSGSYTDLTSKPTLFSGSYTDLTSKPTIPTVPTTVSSFTNDSGYLVSSALSSYLTSATASSTYFPLAGGSLTGALKEAKVSMGANDVNLNSGNFFTKTISGATTFTVSNVPSTGTAASFILDLTNGGAGTITWWSGVKWAGGTAPTLTASGRDSLGFFTHDGGTTWSGLVLGKDIK